MTRKLTRDEKLLIEVAINPPIYKAAWTHEARIPWEVIKAIRSHLTETGIDWRKIKDEFERIKLENRKAQIGA